MGRNLLKT